jgi:hypothetical protein
LALLLQTWAVCARRLSRGTAIHNLRERRLEANTIGRELMGVDKEIEQLQATMATWDAQAKAQQQEIDIAAAEEQWLHTKYTSEQLYTLMESTVSILFQQTFLMAVDMVKSVRRAMDFELGLRKPTRTIPSQLPAPGKRAAMAYSLVKCWLSNCKRWRQCSTIPSHGTMKSTRACHCAKSILMPF